MNRGRDLRSEGVAGYHLIGLSLLVGVSVAGCHGGDEDDSRRGTDIIVPDEPVPGVTSGCGSVRLTSYDAGDSGWCEFRHDHAILPDFVRRNLTLAIAEPYDTSSYGGEPGEACGECWEVDTISGTEVVMVDNLCPIEGNPLCAGGHFHFDLSQESAAALGGGGLDAAVVRRVPCPVTGTIHAQLNDRNEWGYVRLAFINHRFPIRAAEYRAVDGEEWRPVQRSGGAWHVLDDGETFAAGAPGGVFRFTSPTGEIATGDAVLTDDVDVDAVFDTGAQFADADPAGDTCVFTPPGDVYDEAWGGIDQVRWAPNPWGDATASETTEGCADGSASCVLIANLEQWAGFHLYYRQSFPTATFASLTLRLRAATGGGELVVAPSSDGETCEDTTVTVGAEWVEVEIDIASVCGGLPELNGLTASNTSDAMDLVLDEIRFE